MESYIVYRETKRNYIAVSFKLDILHGVNINN